jgi:hypothetical protein
MFQSTSLYNEKPVNFNDLDYSIISTLSTTTQEEIKTYIHYLSHDNHLFKATLERFFTISQLLESYNALIACSSKPNFSRVIMLYKEAVQNIEKIKHMLSVFASCGLPPVLYARLLPADIYVHCFSYNERSELLDKLKYPYDVSNILGMSHLNNWARDPWVMHIVGTFNRTLNMNCLNMLREAASHPVLYDDLTFTLRPYARRFLKKNNMDESDDNVTAYSAQLHQKILDDPDWWVETDINQQIMSLIVMLNYYNYLVKHASSGLPAEPKNIFNNTINTKYLNRPYDPVAAYEQTRITIKTSYLYDVFLLSG